MQGPRVLLAQIATIGALSGLVTGCRKPAQPATSGAAKVTTGSPLTGPATPQPVQVKPPFDLENPPADATKTASGLTYKKIVTDPAGTAPKRNDTVMISFTGWDPSTGKTFFSTEEGKPLPLNLASAAPGFVEGMQLLKKGEKAMFWVPPDIGYKNKPQGTPKELAYEVELVDIDPAPAIPADVANPPADVQKTKGGIPFVVVRQGTGKDKAKDWDDLTFNYTAWDATGRMFDSTEMKKRPQTAAPYREPKPLEEVLTGMTAGERVRFWVKADDMRKGQKVPGMPDGQLCYEVELLTITPGVEPPPVPADVAKPPPDAKKTAKGVFYKVLKAGTGTVHPTPNDTVRVNYTGWTTDGKMFDSSVVRKQPATFNLHGVIAGWTDGIPTMTVGEKARFWIPEELAYKGAPGQPQGMLVFDVELLSIEPAGRPAFPPPHGMPGHGMPPHGMPPHGPPPGPPHGVPGHP